MTREQALKLMGRYVEKNQSISYFLVEKDGDFQVSKGIEDLNYAKENGYNHIPHREYMDDYDRINNDSSTSRGIGSTSVSGTGK